jgi:ubiquinone/menaquinone biosynthesis C-methylase UbiE
MSSDSVKFDRAADYYDATRGFPQGEEIPIARLIAQAGQFNKNSRVLEIGVGTGRIALPVVGYVGQYIGIDLSRPMMDKLRDKQDAERVSLIEGDATQLPFGDALFDGAVVSHVFHLIPNWQEALAELRRVLRPDARLIHIWSQDDDLFRPLWDAWNAAVPEKADQDYGVSRQARSTFLADAGWQSTGEPLTHSYPIQISMQQFLDLARGRKWSSCWRYTDDELTRAVAAMEAVMPAVFPNPEQSITRMTTVCVGAYSRP